MITYQNGVNTLINRIESQSINICMTTDIFKMMDMGQHIINTFNNSAILAAVQKNPYAVFCESNKTWNSVKKSVFSLLRTIEIKIRDYSHSCKNFSFNMKGNTLSKHLNKKHKKTIAKLLS